MKTVFISRPNFRRKSTNLAASAGNRKSFRRGATALDARYRVEAAA